MGLGVAWDPGWVLLRKDTLERIAAGEIDGGVPVVEAAHGQGRWVRCRRRSGCWRSSRWSRSRGGGRSRMRTPKRAGFASRAALLKAFPRKPGRPAVSRRVLRWPGRTLGSRCEQRADLERRRARRDREAAGAARRARRSARGPAQTLELIAARPETRAGDLAADLGQERLPFKANVRKLKALGLTESLEVGYRLSPRGRAYLAERERPTPV